MEKIINLEQIKFMLESYWKFFCIHFGRFLLKKNPFSQNFSSLSSYLLNVVQKNVDKF